MLIQRAVNLTPSGPMSDRNRPKGKYYGISWFMTYPSSRGHVHVSSRDVAWANPDFSSGFLEQCVLSSSLQPCLYILLTSIQTSEDDIELHVFGYKRSREFARRMACHRGEYPPSQPDFAKDSPAAVREDPSPVPIDAPDIQYTEEDNEKIKEYMRRMGT